MKKVLNATFALAMAASLTACTSGESSAPAASSSKETISGVFTGTAPGRNGDITVEVTLTDSTITDVTVKEHAETFAVGCGMEETPIEALPAKITANNSIAVDNVSGATLSSFGVKNAVTKALEAAGADTADYMTVPAADTVESEYNVDVVVVGAGGAGLSAAIEAANNGAKVLVLEKNSITGGSTTVSGGKTLASGTVLQKEQGIEDSADQLYEYMTSLGNNENTDDEVLRTFVDNSASAIDFMLENGVLFGEVERTHASLPIWRVHNAKDGYWMNSANGGWITVGLTDSCKKTGTEILFNTPATELIVNNGTVAGVKAKHGDQDVTVNAKAVILTCGGFEYDFETMAAAQTLAGLEPTNITTAGCGNTGDAIRMASAVNAEYSTDAGASYTYVSFTCGAGIYEEAGLILCEDGHRVCNEYSYQYEWTKYLVQHDSSIAWYVTDADDPNQMIQYGMSLDSTLKADTVEELAAQMGVDPETLKTTIDTYNASCQSGTDAEFGKPAEFLNELTGTLFAIRMDRSYSFTFGGLKTNKEAEVIDKNGNAIPNLYAAGECALYSLLGTSPEISYPSCGTAIGNDVVFGRIAGANAAALAN